MKATFVRSTGPALTSVIWRSTELAACGLVLVSSVAIGAEYPDRPVRVVIPYSPGGPGDLLGRQVAEKLAASFGRPFVVENRAGAGLVVGAQYAAKSRKW